MFNGRRCGSPRSGSAAPRPGLSNYLGQWNAADQEAARQVEDAIERAVELGINYFDTAPGYGRGLSEEMFGRALKRHRARVVLATKVRGATEDEIRESVEASLARLQTDHLDLIQYHGGWSGTRIECFRRRWR